LPARPDWLGDPQRGLVHPGPLTVLADSACGAAVGLALDRAQPYATLDLRMDLLRPASPDRGFSCTAECFRMTTSVAFTRATVWQEDEAAPIATALATFMRGTATKRPARAASEAASGADASAPEARPAEIAPGATTAPAAGWAAPATSESITLGPQRTYVDYLGMRASRAEDGGRIFRLPFDAKLIGNPVLPALHGGVIAAFAETSAYLHLVDALPESKLPKAIDFSIDYLRSGRPVETFARCETIRVGNRVALVQTWCWQTSPAQPIALTRGHFLLADPDAA
ncbi:MAG TPA: hotdog domain-containing protein, partial [Quisquiliibacterium sp.]|nr:hotdog domain-containing protein [Quisquiliibacterium sp.]